jgi:acetolactate synthase-1/2/3 large subunit
VLLIGGWCGEAAGAIRRFRHGRTPPSSPRRTARLISPRHPLFRGVFGFGGHASAEAALRDPAMDLVLAIGASMGE